MFAIKSYTDRAANKRTFFGLDCESGPAVLRLCEMLALCAHGDGVWQRLLGGKARICKVLANEIKPEFIKYIEGHTFMPKYVEVVSSTPEEILNKASAERGWDVRSWTHGQCQLSA